MCQEFELNRKKITQLVYQRGVADFSANELIEEFKENNGGLAPVISGSESVEQYLLYLARLGALEHQGNRYRAAS